MKNSMLASARLSIRLLTRRQRIIYRLLTAFRAILGIFDVIGIAMIGLISAVAVNGLNGSKPTVIANISIPPLSETWLVGLVLMVLALFVVKTIAALILIRRTTRFVASVETAASTTIARHLLTGNLSEVSRFSRGEILWAVLDSTKQAFTGILNSVSTLIAEFTLLVLVLVMFMLVNALAAIIVLAYFAVIVLGIQIVIERGLQAASREGAEGVIGTTSTVNDSLDAYREISVLGKSEFFLMSFRKERGKLAEAFGSNAFLTSTPRYVIETSLILGVVLFVCTQFVIGELSSGILTLGVFLTGGVRIMASLLPLQAAVTTLKTAASQADSAQDMLLEFNAQGSVPRGPSSGTSSQERQTAISSPDDCGVAVSLDRIHFAYPDSQSPALQEITLSINPGDKVAIIGPSGSGKTTLVDIVLGLLEPDSGSVLLDGETAFSQNRQFSEALAYVPQKPGIISGTIASNVALGIDPSDIDRSEVERSLRQAHLWELVSSLPDGIDASVGKQSDALSGGQIQRLGIARALYTRPRLLILDEATSALDAGAEALVSQTLSELGSEVTVIVIAHRLSTVQHSDCVYVLEGGKIIASGKFAELRKKVPMVAAYVELMSFDV
jgi:ABC-type multidrug transport system fused ATPase/permease subunit